MKGLPTTTSAALLALAALLTAPSLAAQPAPSADAGPVARATALKSSLDTELLAVQAEWAKLPPRAAELTRARDELRTATLDFALLRSGLQACFSAPTEGPCGGAAVEAARGYVGGLEPALEAPLRQQLEGLDGLRISLSELVVRLRRLDDDASRARQEIERLVQDAYQTAQRIDEHPLEAARVKAAHIDAWRRVSAEREGVLTAVRSVQATVRPLDAQISALRAATVDALALYGAEGLAR